ncbi:bifunctional 4-hydroxy-2-oxoglutarate aldolase/2-dehydro-3-deoxy-phosphogluconate aldolase [Planosporangium flavigriseum]|uniref:Ketohydroxyglutarate aldolase n=1 Tax=Planosporangium flavigriseum TaxID=373681 RepID=A0A8J3PP66_9ACTN|nr:bifunctional 4-hydroxy-2-oxoglutarate aldolase/2-dehydro-3-deoxy-phosphogluconate aldolase [Planosporangium flavigriseum]NJC67477.1 bifunctional 4-hydroxy-2-oxoglutarate aldolase/2-dehydro-3-deoxy-phosphogluconate aldolase [Planosporangium flavigriseum]GIG75573.1 ketohydroxyglutarate aldolase [Planosporangium flavigriseum]
MRFRTIAILRAYEPQRAADLADQCWAIGMDLVEVPVQGSPGWAALEAVAERAQGRAFGAGTVLSADDARRAAGMGASVIISPDIDADVVEAALNVNAVPLPGVMTPTDVGQAARLGLDTCKLFPASVVGPAWLGAIKGPFPAMNFIAVGGVDLGNAAGFIKSGATGVALGSSIETLLSLDDPAAFIAELHDLVE